LQVDGLGGFVAQAHPQPLALGGDREVLVTEAPHQVEGLLGGLLLRAPKCVGFNALLDRRAHLRRCPEVPVRGDEPVQCLVGPLEVVALHEEPEPPLAISEVREDRATQEFIPQGLPEALDLAERLGVLRPALDVPDAVLAQTLLEERLATPRGVLPPLVRQDLLGRPVGCDPPFERLEHQRALLVVRQHEAHQEARVVVHERRQVEPLVPPQQKGEDVRLPELVRRRPLEAARRSLATLDGTRHRWRHHADVRQDSLHRARRHPEGLEALDQIADAARTVLGVPLLERHHRCHHRV
jgi:hypothetical protein